MKKVFIVALILIIATIAGFFAVNAYIYNEKQAGTATDYVGAEYMIEGVRVTLGDKVKYFGNELVTDLNDDGRDDVVFLVTSDGGGSGTFFYVVAALNTESGYVGSDGYFLGDRIAPQTTEVSRNPQHKNVIVVNYADRAAGEPMATKPSVGTSTYLKLDTESMRWGVVENNFPGEANPQAMSLGMKTWVWQRAQYNDGKEIVPAKADAFTLTFSADGSFSASTDCNHAGGAYVTNQKSLTFKDIFSTLMYCEGSQETEFLQLLEHTGSFHFTSHGELILDLVYDSGTATFK